MKLFFTGLFLSIVLTVTSYSAFSQYSLITNQDTLSKIDQKLFNYLEASVDTSSSPTFQKLTSLRKKEVFCHHIDSLSIKQKDLSKHPDYKLLMEVNLAGGEKVSLGKSKANIHFNLSPTKDQAAAPNFWLDIGHAIRYKGNILCMAYFLPPTTRADKEIGLTTIGFILNENLDILYVIHSDKKVLNSSK